MHPSNNSKSLCAISTFESQAERSLFWMVSIPLGELISLHFLHLPLNNLQREALGERQINKNALTCSVSTSPCLDRVQTRPLWIATHPLSYLLRFSMDSSIFILLFRTKEEAGSRSISRENLVLCRKSFFEKLTNVSFKLLFVTNNYFSTWR